MAAKCSITAGRCSPDAPAPNDRKKKAVLHSLYAYHGMYIMLQRGKKHVWSQRCHNGVPTPNEAPMPQFDPSVPSFNPIQPPLVVCTSTCLQPRAYTPIHLAGLSPPHPVSQALSLCKPLGGCGSTLPRQAGHEARADRPLPPGGGKSAVPCQAGLNPLAHQLYCPVYLVGLDLSCPARLAFDCTRLLAAAEPPI